MTLYKFEFKVAFTPKGEHHDYKYLKSSIENAIREVKEDLKIVVEQKFQFFGHNYSFKAEFQDDKSKEILNIFRKYGTIMHSCLEEHHTTDEEVEIDQHLKIK